MQSPVSPALPMTNLVSRACLGLRALGASILGVTLVSCNLPPHQTIVVKDQAGKAVANATLTPYPTLPQDYVPLLGGAKSNAEGKIEIFDIAKDGKYKLAAPGYEPREIRYPRRDNRTFLLRRAD